LRGLTSGLRQRQGWYSLSFWPQMLEESKAKNDVPFMQNRDSESGTWTE